MLREVRRGEPLHGLLSLENARSTAVAGPECAVGGAARRAAVGAAQVERDDRVPAAQVDNLLFPVAVGAHRRPRTGRSGDGRRGRQAARLPEQAEISRRVR